MRDRLSGIESARSESARSEAATPSPNGPADSLSFISTGRSKKSGVDSSSEGVAIGEGMDFVRVGVQIPSTIPPRNDRDHSANGAARFARVRTCHGDIAFESGSGQSSRLQQDSSSHGASSDEYRCAQRARRAISRRRNGITVLMAVLAVAGLSLSRQRAGRIGQRNTTMLAHGSEFHHWPS